jgi:hypothetical protein
MVMKLKRMFGDGLYSFYVVVDDNVDDRIDDKML